MNKITRIYRAFSLLIPKKIRINLEEAIELIKISPRPPVFAGFLVSNIILVSLLAGFSVGFFLNKSALITSASVFIFLILGIYFIIILAKDKRIRMIEETLPDALQLMSSNLRSGMSPDRAFLLSARPEFGPLQEEISFIGRKVALGNNISMALTEMALKIKSKRLIRSVELINSSIRSGGSLATLLEATSKELREQNLIDLRIKASITMYIIFIFSAITFISPVLFGLSTYLVEILRNTFAQIDLTSISATNIPISISNITITKAFLNNFIAIFIIANSFMTSMLLGLIGKGKRRSGLKYFFPMIIVGIAIFYITQFLIETLFSGLFVIQ